MVIIIKERATFKQVEEMLQILRVYIKVVVDIERSILAGGGEKHAQCEAVLLEDGSRPNFSRRASPFLEIWRHSGVGEFIHRQTSF